MAIRTANPRDAEQSPEYRRLRRWADQEWELAGLARRDGDAKSAAFHTEKAQEYDALAKEARK